MTVDRETWEMERQIDRAQAAERQDQWRAEVGNAAEYLVPPVAGQIGLGLLLATVAVLILRNRRGYLPEWCRTFLGVKRTLRSRADLRPKPSPLQPDAWRH